ncbi:MauE/DoxX family redox-associated membrane protein [Desulfocastanea catecholica]
MDEKKNLQERLLWVDRIGRWIISLIFLAAGLPKLFDVRGFAEIIDAYALLPDMLLLPAAVVLPVVEVGLAVGLLFNSLKSKVGVALLLLFFIVLLAYSIGQGLDIDCGCFGPEDPEHTAFQGLRAALVRDIVMFVPLLYSFWYHRYRHCTFSH